MQADPLPTSPLIRALLHTPLADIPATVIGASRDPYTGRVFLSLVLENPIPHPHFGQCTTGEFAAEFVHPLPAQTYVEAQEWVNLMTSDFEAVQFVSGEPDCAGVDTVHLELLY